jgi:hypothetical protein
MMDIGILANIRLGSIAYLAGIAVALACLLTLLFPVGAIIIFPATSPVRVILANYVLRHPLPSAFQVAKESFTAARYFGTKALKELPAFGTLNSHGATLPVGGPLASKVLRGPLTATLRAACSLVRVDSLKFLSALWADLGAFASILWGTLSLPVFTSPLGNTGTVTEIKVLDKCRAHTKCLPTPGAFDLRSLSTLPGMITLLAAKGVPFH